ncbi:hypothetical protein ERO13_A08G165050v2 [Gossypium hirsutum]|uniref:Uncharacterized protein n=1 Tax=Gossypium tomentosum TaxID=34277 RepID=A0A5D2PK07_GOSTO|nr:hypothetical protein ERO13_A08G165050v2 [Gossypium hirsutum]TYI15534.1 hypothetical protein ES332_A08G192900v1 [Gossypium tomentosum]
MESFISITTTVVLLPTNQQFWRNHDGSYRSELSETSITISSDLFNFFTLGETSIPTPCRAR